MPSTIGRGSIVVLLCALTLAAVAQEEKKPAPESEAPSLLSVLPFGIARGATNKLVLRGKHLSDLTAIRLQGCRSPSGLKWTAKDPAPPAKPEDKSKPAPEESLDLTFKLPDDAPLGTNVTLVAIGPKGQSKPMLLYVAAAGKLIDEKEPNGGFKESQTIQAGWTIAGTISAATDVDVFKVHAKSGQKLRAELFAGQLGSALDGSLSVYDSKGALLGSNDDAAGRDSALDLKCPAEGDYFVVLTSVGEIPAKTTPPYLLKVVTEP